MSASPQNSFASAFGHGRGDQIRRRLLTGADDPGTRARVAETAERGVGEALALLGDCVAWQLHAAVFGPLQAVVLAEADRALVVQDAGISKPDAFLKRFAPDGHGDGRIGSDESAAYPTLVAQGMALQLPSLIGRLHGETDIRTVLVPAGERYACSQLAYERVTGPDGEEVLRTVFGARYRALLARAERVGAYELCELLVGQVGMFDAFHDWIPGADGSAPPAQGEDVQQLIERHYRHALMLGINRHMIERRMR